MYLAGDIPIFEGAGLTEDVQADLMSAITKKRQKGGQIDTIGWKIERTIINNGLPEGWRYPSGKYNFERPGGGDRSSVKINNDFSESALTS